MSRVLRRAILSLLLLAPAGADCRVALAQRKAATRAARARPAKVCPDPVVPCPSEMTFEPYDLRFRLPKNAVIYDSEEFYAVILKTVRMASYDDCDKFVPEDERRAAQQIFPRRKVFTSRCPEAGSVFYTNVAERTHFMAVYGGATRAEAERTLAEVRATGKFPGAFLRRMRIGVNGT